MNIIVAKYKEDISWISRFKNCTVIVYDKSGEENMYNSLPNIGRESHTYLTYIIENYNNLPNYICFLQGDPEVHLTYGLEHIDNMYFDDINFFPLCQEFDCDLNGLPQHKDLQIKELIFDRYFIDIPEFITFVAGAQFIVSKQAILNRSKEFYELLLKDSLRTDIDDVLFKSNKMPWVLERVWSYIFNPKFKTKYDI